MKEKTQALLQKMFAIAFGASVWSAWCFCISLAIAPATKPFSEWRTIRRLFEDESQPQRCVTLHGILREDSAIGCQISAWSTAV